MFRVFSLPRGQFVAMCYCCKINKSLKFFNTGYCMFIAMYMYNSLLDTCILHLCGLLLHYACTIWLWYNYDNYVVNLCCHYLLVCIWLFGRWNCFSLFLGFLFILKKFSFVFLDQFSLLFLPILQQIIKDWEYIPKYKKALFRFDF